MTIPPSKNNTKKYQSASEILKAKVEEHILTSGLTPIELKRNDFLIKKGQIAWDMHIVKSGALKIFVSTRKDDIILRLGYNGSWMTSFPSFLTGEPSKFNIQAIKRTSLLPISRMDFFDFINSSEETKNLWLNMLEEFAVQQLDREIDVLTRSPYERYKRLLERSPHIFQEIPNKYLASYLRMSPETLSRLKKR
ncbi:Crp/Fnr family transcriptional regulator [Flagellimonas meridianipacifica]|uniref:CRP-like cAMP-binding protein n=1 Tax=Flagellimonas meridianipacifica TaxID=1080225 RepID=A0A2T0MIT3_9FLAO|nr:Crp/Fnr family transcriptional regulator [Allomuricauda pacifica]PRX57416.1 CRP-like cAMP-binding protein [Allomuricauda pacifica]